MTLLRKAAIIVETVIAIVILYVAIVLMFSVPAFFAAPQVTI